MDSYAPALFKFLDPEERKPFEEAADVAFADASDTLEIRVVHHPVYRRRLAELVMQRADEELERMGMVVAR